MALEAAIPRKGNLKPCMTLIPEVPDTTDATSLVVFTLKVRAGNNAATAPVYKKRVQRFDEGSPSQWIEILNSLTEIWTQNSIVNASDRLATIKTILRGDSLTALESSIQDSLAPPEGEAEGPDLSIAIVQLALSSVSANVFPHRALEKQKIWMRRAMRKPFDLSIRKMAAAVSRINNALPLFPGATADDKFSAAEIVELLEFSLPESWRSKFDLDGYIPTLEDKSKLIEACEALERNEAKHDKKPAVKTTVKKAAKSFNKKTMFSRNDKKTKFQFYCTEHGSNATHNTEKCFTLSNKANKAAKNGNSSKSARPSFTSSKFRKEIHLLSKKTSKKKVLDMFASVIQSEQAKLQKGKKPGRAAKAASASSVESDDESDGMSVQAIEVVSVCSDKKPKAKRKTSDTASVEEQAYQERIASLGQSHSDNDSLSSIDTN
jgi:hypothetical protein